MYLSILFKRNIRMRYNFLFNKALEVKIHIDTPVFKLNRNYCQASVKDYLHHCSVLGVTKDSTQDDIHNAFIKLAKRFHPDSGNHEANSEKFKKIETSYRFLKNNPIKIHENEKEVVEADIKHTAPQHRQYLSFAGVSSGNPYQREQEYAKMRAMKAADNVLQHRINKNAVTADDKKLKSKNSNTYSHKIKTKFGIDRLVEDLIQESMSKGEFNNLPGFGKPLKNQNTNPYIDFTTHKLNQVLIENGFTPEWISLQKEIRERINKLKANIANDCSRFNSVDEEGSKEWENLLKKYHDDVTNINKKIQHYNLVVPILQKQMVAINLMKISKEILRNHLTNSNNSLRSSKKKSSSKSIPSDGSSQIKKWTGSKLFNFIGSFIRL